MADREYDQTGFILAVSKKMAKWYRVLPIGSRRPSLIMPPGVNGGETTVRL
jgi:hypothetical protein